MPNKHNDARRQNVLKMKFKVTNWSTYDAAAWMPDAVGLVHGCGGCPGG
jgi:hypothetical protein